MIAEPVIYLVVWTTIAEESGGSVQGITAGEFAAYYIVWTLVRNMNIVFGAPFWEWRIREGHMARDLLRPIHPLHSDVAWFAGSKFVIILLWLPIAIGLTIAFDPTLDPTPLEISVFVVAIWGAYLIRTMLQSTIGMLCFWTTRGAAVFDLYMTTELLLSGRLVPLPLMPDWAQTIAVDVLEGDGNLARYGEVVDRDGDRVTLRVPKNDTARVTAQLLAEQKVADLTVHDPPIEDVIELVFAEPR